ncbi:MAG TPA: dipeptide epimerase [Candidatus Limnocylindrales bacterium]|nr:dipeptide epimerase [Candidatus Limnocylindrales bacterium]
MTGLALTSAVIRLPYREPFRIARAHGGDGMSSMLVELRHPDWPDLVGLGEGYPDAYYGETLETIAVVLERLLAAIAPAELDAAVADPDAGLAAISARFEAAIAHHGAAKCALDTAIHDLVGKRLGRPVYELLGLSPEIGPTDFTVGIDEPEIVAERASRAARFPALKIKVGGPSDLETLEAVRRVFSGPIRVDANTGWTPEQGARLIPDLVRLGVELIEQPFPAHRLDQLRWLQGRSELPLVADESAVTILDLEGLVGVVDGVNVKLAKCGGPGPARRMLARAKELGFKTFLGCMEETSLGIAASAHVAVLADWIDLDGCLLVAGDPFEGLELGPDCRWQLTPEPGLGIRRRAS